MKLLTKLLGRYRVKGYPLQAERRVELGLVIAVAVTILVLFYVFLRVIGVSSPAPVIPGSETLAVASASVPVAVSEELSREVGARPLFWRGRRPEVPIPVEVPEESSEDEVGSFEDVKLVGVFGSGDSVGIIALVGREKQRILHGEELEGWKLVSVKEGKARFRSGPNRQELQLEHANVPPKADDTPDESQHTEYTPMTEQAAEAELGPGQKKSPKPKNAKKPKGSKKEPSDALSFGGSDDGAPSQSATSPEK